MARERTAITGTTLNRALRMTHPHEIGDERVPGLCLRIRSRSVTWALRCRVNGKQTIRTIANARLVKDVEAVRTVALRAKAMIASGKDPSSLFEEFRLSKTPADLEAVEAGLAERVEREERERSGAWKWEDLRDRFLEDTRRNRRRDTYRSYKSVLNLPDWAPLRGKFAVEVTPEDIRRVRQSLVERGAPAQAKEAVRTVKAAFNWACEQPGSGLSVNPIRDVKTTPRTRSQRPEDFTAEGTGPGGQWQKRLLSERELGLLMHELNTVPSPAARLALKLALFTAQRRLTVVQAFKTNFEEEPEGLVWNVDPWFMKAGRRHRIPLPAPAAGVVRQAMILRPDTRWLFPKLRHRRKGDAMDTHMSEKVLTDALRDLQQPGRPLHSPNPFGPHDFRRAFRTYLGRRLGFTNDDAKLILDHREGVGQDVTEEHYSLDEALPRKRKIMEAWVGFLLRLAEEHGQQVACLPR